MHFDRDDYEQASPVLRKLLWALTRFRTIDHPRHTVGGLAPREVRVLFCIANATRSRTETTKVSEISRTLNVTSPSVTQVLNELEGRGLIKRQTDPSDRRSVDVTLTEEGIALTRRAAATRLAHLRELVEYLGEEDSAQFADLLVKVSNFLREKASREPDIFGNGDEKKA